MSTEWFQAKPDSGGVMITNPGDPLAYVWKDRDQVLEIIAKLQAALDQADTAKTN